MMMKNNNMLRLVKTAFLALIPLAASAQNLNPTVEVSRSYEGKLMEVDKPQLKMAVPDSVLRFDLEFDYSVAETPYKGSYEFSPYSIDMAPAPTVRDVNSFYLKAGAGYQLHPMLDFVWSPAFRKPFKMNVYGSHRSFIGNYWNMGLDDDGSGFKAVDRLPKEYQGDRSWRGCDLRTKVGTDGRYDWNAAALGYDVSYDGIYQNNPGDMGRSYNSAHAKAFVRSKPSELGFDYKVMAAYRFAEDRISGPESAGKFLRENDIDLDATFGIGLKNGRRGLLDFGIDMVSTDGEIVSGGADLDIVPHYLIENDRWRFDLGLRISTAFKTISVSDSYKYREQIVYPDVRIEFSMVEGLMKAYMDFGGDCGVNSYSDVLGYNGRADMTYGRGLMSVMDITEQKFTATIGLEGRIGNRFSYDLRGGYANNGSALLDGMVISEGMLLPTVGYHRYDEAFVTLDWLWDMENFRFDGIVDYTYAYNIPKKYTSGFFFPAAVTGDVSFSYNWNRRVTAGIDCEFSTARKGSTVDAGAESASFIKAVIPGYADLGVNAEYVINRKMSVWLRGGNLIGMTIQRSLLYAEKGPYFTAGICLNL